jgi:hypothetical protein
MMWILSEIARLRLVNSSAQWQGKFGEQRLLLKLLESLRDGAKYRRFINSLPPWPALVAVRHFLCRFAPSSLPYSALLAFDAFLLTLPPAKPQKIAAYQDSSQRGAGCQPHACNVASFHRSADAWTNLIPTKHRCAHHRANQRRFPD